MKKRRQKKASSKPVNTRTKKKATNIRAKKTGSAQSAAKKTRPQASAKTSGSIKKKKTASKKVTPKKLPKKTSAKAGGGTRKKRPAAKKVIPKKTRPQTSAKTPGSIKEKKTASKKVTPKKSPVTKKAKALLKKKTPERAQPVPKKVWKAEEERKAALRKVLIVRRREILEEAKTEISKYIKGETRQLVDTALDDGDWSVVDLSEDINLRQLGSHRENLQRIDEALRKLNEGTYGICEDCGDEISNERLKVLPFAIYCVDCQERREQIAEMERKHGII